MSASTLSISVRQRDEFYPTRNGRDLPVRVWSAAETTGAPCLVHFHGGGGTTGQHLSIHSWWIEELVHSGVTVVSPSYPLAPLGNLGTQLRACEDLYKWTCARDDVDETRIILGGYSWGGTLASLTSHRVHPKPKAVVSLYGIFDFLDAYFTDGKNLPSDPYEALSEECTENGVRVLTAQLIQSSLLPAESLEAPIFAPRRLNLTTETESALRITDSDAFTSVVRRQNDIAIVAGRHGRCLEVVLPRTERMSDAEWLRARREQSPMSAFTGESPPHLLVHGSEDMHVPHHHSQTACGKLRKLGVETRLITVEGGAHVCDKHWKSDSVERSEVGTIVRSWLGLDVAVV